MAFGPEEKEPTEETNSKGDPLSSSLARDASYEPDIEDFLPAPPAPPSPLARYPSPTSAKPAVWLLTLSLLVSSAQWLRPSGTARIMSETYASYETVFRDHQWWRLFTALFTHADLGHLLANTPLILIFGWYLRDLFGFYVFPGMAILLGILANALTIVFYPPETRLIGASGMLYGMVALWLLLYVHFETAYTRSHRFFRAVGVSLLLLFPTTFHQDTSYLCHGFGFFLGFLFGFIFKRFIKIQTNP